MRTRSQGSVHWQDEIFCLQRYGDFALVDEDRCMAIATDLGSFELHSPR